MASKQPPRHIHVDGEKRCTKCNEWFPADKEFFYGDAGEQDGLRRICKACYADTPCIIKRNEQRHKREVA